MHPVWTGLGHETRVVRYTGVTRRGCPRSRRLHGPGHSLNHVLPLNEHRHDDVGETIGLFRSRVLNSNQFLN